MDQPGKVANPARGQLNRGNEIPLSPYVPENVVSRNGFSRPVPRQPAHFSILRLNLVLLLTEFLPISSAASIYLFRPQYAIGSVPSISRHAIAYRRRSLLRVRWHRANGPQGSSSSGCCNFAGHHGPICVPLFSHTVDYVLFVFSQTLQVF